MSRVIKFRAWHTINKVMYQHKDIPVGLKNVEDDNVWKYMQYTGLKDKNGKEIYEGDILTVTLVHPDHVGLKWKVEFIFGAFQITNPTLHQPLSFVFYAFSAIEEGKITKEEDLLNTIEVIGNIFTITNLKTKTP